MKTLIVLGEFFAVSAATTAVWWYFLRPKHLWSGAPESKFTGYSLFKTRWILGGKFLLRKEFFAPLVPFYCYIIRDKDGDGIADHKALVVSAGRASRTEEKELDDLDREAYVYAIQQWRAMQVV